MNDDLELLKLAAKAAGYDVEFMPLSGANIVSGERCGLWRPLEDDGDALRLAVKLRIRFAGMGERACAFIGLREFWEDEGSDPCAATRRAIVRAAAEIGKSMP